MLDSHPVTRTELQTGSEDPMWATECKTVKASCPISITKLGMVVLAKNDLSASKPAACCPMWSSKQASRQFHGKTGLLSALVRASRAFPQASRDCPKRPCRTWSSSVNT